MMFVSTNTFPREGNLPFTSCSATAMAVWLLPPPRNPDVSQTAPGNSICEYISSADAVVN